MGRTGLVSLAVVLSFAGAAPAQQAPQQVGPQVPITEQLKDELAQLKDFVHFVRIARYDVAISTGQQLLARSIAPKDFARLIDESREVDRFLETMSRAQRVGELEPTAAQFLKLYTTGKLALARDPEQVKANIAMLSGNMRGRLLAQERLAAAGEYAVPQLLAAYLDPKDVLRQAQAQQVLVTLGPKAVIPLGVSLPRLEPSAQERVVDLLGVIQYRTAAPFLADLARTTSSQSVRQAATRALERMEVSPGQEPAQLYVELAERYYAQAPEVTSFGGEDFQLLWDYDPSVGLMMNAIRTPVYHEAMAMRLSERALALTPSDTGALALWLAANIRREIETPEGYANPAYAADKRDAAYFAVAAGPAVDQRVLARAIDTRNTPLARRAIDALLLNAGGAALWSGDSARKPLLEALSYPNRRVQYEAALALAAAQPREEFAGANRVVPILAGAIREADSKLALVLVPDAETYQVVRAMLERSQYKVLPRGRTVSDVASVLAQTPAIDLVVLGNLPASGVPDEIEKIRQSPTIAATPVAVLTDAGGAVELRARYESDAMVAVRRAAVGEETLLKVFDELVKSASGGAIEPDEARRYASRSLAALRELAISGNTVLSVNDAAASLIAALPQSGGQTKLDIAEVLARVDQRQAQQALFEAALGASGAERLALINLTASSAKRFGHQLEARHVEQLAKLSQAAAGDEATALAALMGALNLPNTDLVPLIIGKK